MLNKKIKTLLIGTNNKGKLREIRSLLPKKVVTLSASAFKLKSPLENGKTFEQNSSIKSKYFSKKTNLICLADDSGLEIDLLNKSPGIYSARWGGKSNNFKIAISRVYKELSKKDNNWKKKIIRARFVCVISIFNVNKKIAVARGKIEGTISTKPKGKNGFGYDPIFIPKNKKITFGQMKPSQKYKLDHRFKAFKKIKKFF
tara:strand:- start:83 stop:685 length:603 start_codon:yes stop_codon:yes gene_type:complete